MEGKELALKALDFAKERHKGQKRKFLDTDYFYHPVAVSLGLQQHYEEGEEDWEVISAGVLHDTIEDTNTTYEELKEEFTTRVADLVQELTIDKEEKKKVGKKEYLTKHMSNMSDEALLIKLIDRLDNVYGLHQKEVPIKFVKWYLKETEYILKNIRREFKEYHKTYIGS